MLEAIGLKDYRDLYRDVPQSMILDRPLDVPSGMSELEVSRTMTAMAEKNRVFSTVLRASGPMTTISPALSNTSRPRKEFLTAYTPIRRR